MKNVVVAQSGGPTAAINATALGVILEALKSDKVEKVYAGINGIKGIIEGRLVDLTERLSDSEAQILLETTPAAAFGSCRKKLKSFDENDEDYKKIVEVFRKYNIGYLCNYLKEEFKDDLQDKKIDLQINSSCDNKLINIDLVKIRRVFGNIINNSVNKFNSNKGNIIIDMSYSLNI